MTLINPQKLGDTGEGQGDNGTPIRIKAPKRVLHFSDGILEEYSDDEEVAKVENQQLVDPATLTWVPWLWYKAWSAGNGTLAVVDYIGEFFASFFGITTPKYYFELEEYKKREAELQKMKEERKGWSEPANENIQMGEVHQQPQPTNV